jgi:hypothetical protein
MLGVLCSASLTRLCLCACVLAQATAIVATLLLAYDIRLAHPASPLPPSNQSRVGLVLTLRADHDTHPGIDIQIRRKSRGQQANTGAGAHAAAV